MDITRLRGDTYADEFIIKSKTTKLAIDLTDHTFLLTLNQESNPTDATNQIYQLTGSITNAVGGTVEFAPSSVEADQVGVFYFDVQMIDVLGRKRTVVKGKYTYTQDLTK